MLLGPVQLSQSFMCSFRACSSFSISWGGGGASCDLRGVTVWLQSPQAMASSLPRPLQDFSHRGGWWRCCDSRGVQGLIAAVTLAMARRTVRRSVRTKSGTDQVAEPSHGMAMRFTHRLSRRHHPPLPSVLSVVEPKLGAGRHRLRYPSCLHAFLSVHPRDTTRGRDIHFV